MNKSTSKTYKCIDLNIVKANEKLDKSFVDDDALLTSLIEEAISMAENITRRDIAQTVTTIEEDYYRADFSFYDYKIYQADIVISSITITNASGTYTVPPSQYKVEKYGSSSIVRFVTSVNGSKMVITYNSGYSSSSEMPPAMRRAIFMKIDELYRQGRGGWMPTTMQYTRAFETLLSPYVLNTIS